MIKAHLHILVISELVVVGEVNHHCPQVGCHSSAVVIA